MVLKINDPVLVNFNELQLYDYRSVRFLIMLFGWAPTVVMCSGYRWERQTMRTYAFLNGLITIKTKATG